MIRVETEWSHISQCLLVLSDPSLLAQNFYKTVIRGKSKVMKNDLTRTGVRTLDFCLGSQLPYQISHGFSSEKSTASKNLFTAAPHSPHRIGQ
ncbi:hypothetical protein PoB_000813200 [Plakobranchus ocellatus]|uniref:Uncharacterized protein n=1 Tax=Plakobranchus ocellatus TaxID=259542 RepID=A0AAV3YGR2_9GAST|nr:hypothetical protein PoB_000813200 [Plakobranchus ocellatus]